MKRQGFLLEELVGYNLRRKKDYIESYDLIKTFKVAFGFSAWASSTSRFYQDVGSQEGSHESAIRSKPRCKWHL